MLPPRKQRALLAAAALALAALSGCAASHGDPGNASVPIAVLPATVELAPQETARFSATIGGADVQAVRWTVLEANGGSIDATGSYTAPATEGTYHVVASLNDGVVQKTAEVAVKRRPQLQVTVSPTAATVTAGGSYAFAAQVTGTKSDAVTWSVAESGGGTIDAGGVYQAPQAPGVYTVVATSVADPTRSGSASVTVTSAPVQPAPVQVTVSPSSATVTAGGSQAFSATVTGASDTSVTWSVLEPGGGSVTAGGLYTAPDAAGTYTVVARSVADPARAGTAAATVTAASAPPPTATPPASTGSPAFALMSEMYGDAGATAQQRLSQGLLTGATFHPSLTSGEQTFLTTNGAPFGYFAVPAEVNIASCYPSASDSSAGTLLTTLTQQLGPKVWRVGMPEFDQGGGCWASGRPSVAGMSDAQAYSTWTGFYLDTKGLRSYLGQTAAQRGYRWLSVCSFAFCTQYAFDMGSDAVLLERNEDEMSGITPGLAMVRGAAKQHGADREWGIDFSTWRYWNNGATVYSNGRLVTGWSTATMKRNLYIAYMGGANVVHDEAADYTGGAASGSALNPLGQTVQAFHDFAVKRHPDRGTPYVPMAIMQEHASGLEPKFGEWMQGDSKWYWTNGYTAGDRHFANLLAAVYPGYNSWGTLPAGSPKVLASDGSIDISATQGGYRNALANGADPRPWEPFGTSRWGETFDVITNQASLTALQRYRAVVVATGTQLTDALLATLTSYAQGGGIVVLNAKQLGASAETLTGLHLTTSRASASAVTWLPDGSTISESGFGYTVATPTTATVIAQAGGNPVVTRNVVGSGAVYVTTPDLLSDSSGARLLNVGQKLIDAIQAQLAVVQVSGPALEWLVSTDGGRVVVTLVNTSLSGAAWNGTLSFPVPAWSYAVREWTGDTTVASAVQGGRVVVNATVPAYDVRVYVLDPQ